jgi:hypothetical protein
MTHNIRTASQTMLRTRILLVLVPLTALIGHAQNLQPPYALLQYSSLTGSGNTITATEIPVVAANGMTVYVNLVIQFNVDTNGVLSIAPNYPALTPAPTILTSGFRSGTYLGPSTYSAGKALINVAGPGATDGGATQWSLSAASGANPCMFPTSATWYVGPLAASTYSARVQAAGITATGWSFGVGGGSDCSVGTNPGSVPLAWLADSLLGFSQIGNTITIASFSFNGTDKSTPQDQIVYTLQQ